MPLKNLHDTFILTEDFNQQAINTTTEVLQTLANEGNPANIKNMFNSQMAE